MTIAKTAARKQYSGNDSTDVFAFPYRFFADGDLQVYLLDAGGTETLQTITTHYTVSNNGDETGGNVTMVTPPATGETLTIIRRIPQTQSTDYADNDAFPAETHEAALDRLTLIVQDMQEELDRSVTVDVSESVDVDTLQANISTLAAIDSDITTVAGISANVTTVAGISANVTTVAGISANVTTVAGISADVTTVANDGTDIGIVAGDTTHIQALGPISADITTVSGISANVTTVAGISANVTTVAGISANVTTVAGISANVTTVAGISANVTTVAGISADVTTVAGISADVTTVAGISADVTALAAGSWPTWLKLTFDTTTAAADPGAGKIRFNNATPASVTALYIDNADADTNDISGLLDSWTPGQIMVRQVSDPMKWAVFNVASVADSTGYRTFTVTYVDGGTLPDNSGTVGIGFATQGADGSGTLNNIVEDTTPQLGGALDGQGNDLNNMGVLFLTEQAAAEADVAGKGQWWVQTATPNLPMFTDDAGTDFQVATTTDLVGQQTIWMPAGAMTPTTTNGGEQTTEELATNDVMKSYIAFDDSTQEHACFDIQMPKGWNEGTLVCQFIWYTSATSGDCIFGIQAVAVADDDAQDAAYGTAVEVTDTAKGTANDATITAETSAMTVSGSPAAEELVQFKVYRKAADGSDTMTGDAKLVGVKIHYTTDALTDD